jgi:2-amino-4-hydroxy-6-hydroxymethyldihydropteridine diphosphokinase
LTILSIAGEWRLAKALGSATVGNNLWRQFVAAWTAPPKAFAYLPQIAMSICLISLGSNEGDRQEKLVEATDRLAAHPRIRLVARSSWRETAAVGGPSGQSNFLNGAVKLETSLAPHELLGCLQQIEGDLGRRRTERWGPRPIDLDLLLYDELVLATPELVLPHPRMAWRRFVLEPAAEVAGSMVHPAIGWNVARLLAHLDESMPYVAVTGPIAAGKTRLAERLAGAISGRLILEQPDWSRLDAFYAAPAGHAWATELEFLEERGRLLAAEAPQWANRRWVVSDFWFDQSAAFARAWLPGERLETFLERYERLRQAVVLPRLIVLLDAPADELLARIRGRGRECERRLTAAQLERIRHAVIEQAARPDVGPVLRAGDDHTDVVFAEVLAAVRGME